MSSRTLRATCVMAAAVLVMAAEARFLGLGMRSLWFDEAYSVWLARTPVRAIVAFLHANDTHPPLYYVVLGVWMRVFGSTEGAVRALSALAGFLAVPLLYAFARQMVEVEVALIAAALLAGSAFATVSAQEARMYPLLGLLALGSWTALRLAIRQRGRWPWAVYVLSSGLMLYAHYFGFLVLGSQVAYLIPLARRDRRLGVTAGLALAAAGLLFLPWVPAFVAQATSGRGWPTFRPPLDASVIADLLGLYGFGGELGGMGGYFHMGILPLWQKALVVLPVVGLVASGVYALRGERAWCLLCYWAVPIAAAFTLSLRHNVFYPRYFSFLAPPFALLAAGGIDGAARALLRFDPVRRLGRPAAAAGLAAVVLLANAPVLTGYRWHQTGNYDWRDAAALVSRDSGANDYLLFVPGFARIPFEYYYRGPLGRLELTPIETYQMISLPPPAPRVDKGWARRLAVAHPRVWVVTTTPMTGRSYLRLRDLLVDSFTPGTVWDFNDVYVIAVTSRRFGDEVRRP